MEKLLLSVPNITCHHCINSIKRELSELPGVLEVEGDLERKQIQIVWEKPCNPTKIKELLKEIGYPGKEV